MKLSPQCQQIVDWFEENPGRYITTLIAMRDLGICCLHKRIAELQQVLHYNNKRKVWERKAWEDTFQISRKMLTVKNRFGKTRHVMGYKLMNGKGKVKP